MIAGQIFYDIFFTFFYPTASATAEGENWVSCSALQWLKSTISDYNSKLFQVMAKTVAFPNWFFGITIVNWEI